MRRRDCLPGEGVTEEEGEETACQGRVLLKRKEERRLGGCYEEEGGEETGRVL